MTERAREIAPQSSDQNLRVLDAGHRLRRPAEFVLAFLAAMVHLALLYVMVNLALYVVTGFSSIGQPFAAAQVDQAMAQAKGSFDGEGGVGLRLAAALMFLSAPVIVNSYRAGRRRLSDSRLWRREEVAGVLCRWAGVGVAVAVFGYLLMATEWPFSSLALLVVVFLLAFVAMNGICEAVLERI